MTPELQDRIDKMVLAFDPWAGDMDDDSVTLRDAFVVVRKSAKCAICFGNVLVGDRVRSQTQRSEQQRKVMTFKFCVDCCAAMARECVDDGQSIEARYALGQRRASRLRATERQETPCKD